jgi:hypothetical protein
VSSYHQRVEEDPVGNPSSDVEPLNPRQVRARRRRRRRQIGWTLFILVALVIFATAYVVVAGDDSSEETTATTLPGESTTTTVAKPFGPYKVTAGVNVRQGPGTTFPSVATIETGHVVFLSCVTDGEVVNGPNGPIGQWLKTTGFGPQGYLTALYVDTKDDLRTNSIPACPK